MTILCVGLVCLDVVNYCKKFPAEDTDYRADDICWCLGGNACHNTTILKQLGTNADLFSSLADDHTLEMVKSLFRAESTSPDYCIIRPNCTLSYSTVLVNLENGSRTILHTPNDLKEPTLDEFIQKIDFRQYSWIHFEGRNGEETRKMMEFLLENRENSTPIISVEAEKIRPYPTLEQLIPLADVVFMSKDFARNQGFHDMFSAVEGIFEKFARKDATVICAWAELGAAAYKNGEIFSSQAFATGKIVDTLGAGDTFVAGMLHNLNRNVDLKTALENACRLAGKKCCQRGLKNLVEK